MLVLGVVMLSLLAALGTCVASAALEPPAKDAACPLVWSAAADIDPGDRVVSYRVYKLPEGRLCGAVHERTWRSPRTGELKRAAPLPQWNPFASDSSDCWPADGEPVSYCVRAVDATGLESAQCSPAYSVVGAPVQCCSGAACRPCDAEGR